MPPAEFKPAILARKRPKTHAFERAATGIVKSLLQQVFCLLYHTTIHTKQYLDKYFHTILQHFVNKLTSLITVLFQ